MALVMPMTMVQMPRALTMVLVCSSRSRPPKSRPRRPPRKTTAALTMAAIKVIPSFSQSKRRYCNTANRKSQEDEKSAPYSAPTNLVYYGFDKNASRTILQKFGYSANLQPQTDGVYWNYQEQKGLIPMYHAAAKSHKTERNESHVLI